MVIYEPPNEKTNKEFLNRSDTNRAILAQKRLEAGNFGFRKERNCTIRVANTKMLISFIVTAKLISAFVFTTHLVQFLSSLNPKFHVSSSLL